MRERAVPPAVVAVGGPPGSGKSTAGRAVARAQGLVYHAAGDLFRAEAAHHGMDLEAFSHYAEAHPEVDRRVDETMSELARPGVLLDGRIQGPLLRRRGVPVHSIVITALYEVRVARIAGRDHRAPEDAARRIRERAESERARYLAEYGIDLETEPADLVVDSTELDADAVRERLLEFLRSLEGAGVS